MGKALLDEIAGAVAEDDGAAGVELGEDDFSGGVFGDALAAFGIDDFDEAHVWVDVEAGGLIARDWEAFGESHFGFGEAVGGHDRDIWRAHFRAEFFELAAHSGWDFFSAENEAFEVIPARSTSGAFLEEMVEEGGHSDDRFGIDLVDDADIALGAYGFSAAGGEHESVITGACIVGLPEGEVGSEGESVDVFVRGIRLAKLHHATATFLKADDIVGSI